MPAEQLDLLAVVKASQTISGVMVREQLLQHAPAPRPRGRRRAAAPWSCSRATGRLDVAAEASSEELPPPSPAGPAAQTSPNRCSGTCSAPDERVLLDDAAADAGRFSGDAYLARARPRSVLCLPIRRQAEVVALLYLENDLVPGAFTPERLLALELLAAQAAISLENALLLERERAGRVEAEAAERRAVLLGEATAVMTSTLDYEGVFGGAHPRVRSRSFADWAIIDLVEEGDKRCAWRARTAIPRRSRCCASWQERYPAGAGSHAPAATVLESGEPLLLVARRRRGRCAPAPSTSTTPS